MFSALVNRELLDQTVSHRYRTLLLMVGVLCLAACVVRTYVYVDLVRAHNGTEEGHEAVRSQVQEGFLGLVMGYTQEKEPNVLSIFCAGLEDEMTRSLRVSNAKNDQIHSRKLGSLFFRINPAFDIVTLMAVAIALAALLLMHDSISGEREAGTLKVLLAGPVRRATVVSAKWTAGVVALGLPVVIAWLMGIILVLVVAQPVLGSSEWTRLAAMVLISVVYCAVFVGAGVLASAWCSRSSTSLALCLFLWVGAALVAPNAVSTATQAVTHMPSRSALAHTIREVNRAVEVEVERHWDPSQLVLQDTAYTRSVKANSITDGSKDGVRAVYADFRRRLREQLAVATSTVALSPTTAFTFVNAELSGTGMGSYCRLHDDWQTLATEYRELQYKWMMTRRADALPAFRPAPIGLGDSLVACRVPVVALCAYAALTLIGSVLVFALRPRVHTEE